jgi:uncharacterized protein HemX
MDTSVAVLITILAAAVIIGIVFIINLAIQLKATARALEETAQAVTKAARRLEQSAGYIEETAKAYEHLARSAEARIESTKELFDMVNLLSSGAKTGWLKILKFGFGVAMGLKDRIAAGGKS